jgi:hypothetical protein
MSKQFKQIKDDEVFAYWDRVQQYLNSEQGAGQINALSSCKLFCDQFNSLVDLRTLQFLRREIFAYTLISPESHSSS